MLFVTFLYKRRTFKLHLFPFFGFLFSIDTNLDVKEFTLFFIGTLNRPHAQ